MQIKIVGFRCKIRKYVICIPTFKNTLSLLSPIKDCLSSNYQTEYIFEMYSGDCMVKSVINSSQSYIVIQHQARKCAVSNQPS